METTTRVSCYLAAACAAEASAAARRGGASSFAWVEKTYPLCCSCQFGSDHRPRTVCARLCRAALLYSSTVLYSAVYKYESADIKPLSKWFDSNFLIFQVNVLKSPLQNQWLQFIVSLFNIAIKKRLKLLLRRSNLWVTTEKNKRIKRASLGF